MIETIKPLYTTVDTEWLERLMETKKVADGTSTLSNLKMVAESLQKARKKHPGFVTKVSDATKEQIHDLLAEIRLQNDVGELMGTQTAVGVLLEEVHEAVEAYLDGDMDAYRHELADTIAVCFRMMEVANG